jgi:hypothetical protein
MSEPPDPLEAELSALRPQEVSSGFRRRVAERLADGPPARRRQLWPIALAGGLAAACLAAAVLLWPDRPKVNPEPVIVQPRPAPPVAAEDPGPTIQAYRRALARSPAELDALLDKHALAVVQANPELVRRGAFTRSDAALHALLGED